jgi:hypothetical protein
VKGKLFRKYAVLFVTLVTGALLANGLIGIITLDNNIFMGYYI